MQEHTGWLDNLNLSMESGLEQEFEARLSQSSTLAFRVAYGVLRHREDAEDVAQEAIAQAYRNFRQLREPNRFRAWLIRIAWRLAINHKRSDLRRNVRETVSVEIATVPNAVDVLAQRERQEQLWKAIDALPEKLRIVIVLSGIEENDIRQVALLLRLPEGTVKSRLFLARQKLKELLK